MRCLLLCLLLTLGASLFATSQYVMITPTGSYTVQKLENQTLNLNNDPEPSYCNIGDGSYYQKWYYYNSGQIGQKCEVGKLDGKVCYFVAQTLNNPCIQVFTDAAENNATPDWTYSFSAGEYANVSAAWNTNLFAAVRQNKQYLYKFSGITSNNPDWTYDGGSTTKFMDVEVNWDGTYIIAGAYVNNVPTLMVFAPGSSTPLYSLVPTHGETSYRQIRIAKGSHYGYMGCNSYFYVWDLSSGTLRGTGSVAASVDCHAISADGNYCSSGFSSLLCYKWNGSNYTQQWSASGGGGYFYSCGFNGDGSRLFAQDWMISANNRIFYYYNTTSSTPVWSYTYKNGGGSNQNVPTAVSSDQAGNFVATGAWGATTDIEELAIMDIANQQVAFAINCPGSIFWANIAPDATRALGTGKAVHANISGSGDYTYGIAYRETGFSSKWSGTNIPRQNGLSLMPNPARAQVSMSIKTTDRARLEIRIYDTTGRLVLTLRENSNGNYSKKLNLSGFEAGVYLISVKANNRVLDSKRLTVLP